MLESLTWLRRFVSRWAPRRGIPAGGESWERGGHQMPFAARIHGSRRYDPSNPSSNAMSYCDQQSPETQILSLLLFQVILQSGGLSCAA